MLYCLVPSVIYNRVQYQWSRISPVPCQVLWLVVVLVRKYIKYCCLMRCLFSDKDNFFPVNNNGIRVECLFRQESGSRAQTKVGLTAWVLGLEGGVYCYTFSCYLVQLRLLFLGIAVFWGLLLGSVLGMLLMDKSRGSSKESYSTLVYIVIVFYIVVWVCYVCCELSELY